MIAVKVSNILYVTSHPVPDEAATHLSHPAINEYATPAG
jgi:hypothetical protein